MSNQKKRSYSSETRQAQAAETRKRILATAKILFEAEGFDGVTIEQLAGVAQVSIPTVYSLFQSKRGVLRALIDEAFPPEEHKALVEEGMALKSPAARLAVTAKLSRRLYDAERAQMELLRSTSLVAPEFKELEREREERRYARQEEAITIMFEEGVLAKALSLAKARDIYWAFTGRDLYRMCIIDRGWSSDEYEQWLAELLAKTLLE